MIQNEKKYRGAGIAGYGQSEYADPVTKNRFCVADAQMITAFRGKYRQRKSETALSSVPVNGETACMPVIRIRQMQITEKADDTVENPLLAISRGETSSEEGGLSDDF